LANCLVTGAAGFIGSHLAERLLAGGHRVVGVDCFTDYYPRPLKERNLETLRGHQRFAFLEADLLQIDLLDLLRGEGPVAFGAVELVFHQAAQAGVRASWGQQFEVYTRNNILATQRLLEAAKEVPLRKFVFASSSSVYGDAEQYPTAETLRPQPVSPYGVTKLAAEHLTYLYGKNFAVPTVSLRYFTVYGPRQRPDMAFHRFIRALLSGGEITVYGDGEQTRDFTFVVDAVEANLLAAQSDVVGEAFNIGGGSRVTVNQVLRLLEEITGQPARLKYVEKQKGDVRHTAADTTKARERLGYRPRVSLRDGLQQMVSWIREEWG